MSEHGERLAKLEATVEAGFKSIGRSIDQLRERHDAHINEERELKVKLDNVERELDQVRGGYKVFLKMLGFFAAFGAVVWGIATWVADQ